MIERTPAFTYIAPSLDHDPFDLRPRYMSPEGQPIHIEAAGSMFSLSRLAAGFSTAALRAEVVPESPWVGVTRLRPGPPVSDGSSDATEIVERFDRAVENAIGDASAVAVTVSGGMDSAAVLVAADRACRRSARRLIPVCLDTPDDHGGQPAAMAAAILDAICVTAPLLVVSPDLGRWPEPAWSPHGPRCDSEPRYHFGVAATAAEAGADVLLHGTGADELVTSPSFLAAELLRHHGFAAARSYLKDRGYSEAEQFIAVLCGRMQNPRTANWYWSMRWPGRAPGHGTATLTAAARAATDQWAASHREESLRVAIDQRATWAQATALHMLFPRDLLLAATDLPERFPFLEPDFARYTYHIPLHRRHRTTGESGYQNSKALVMELLPPQLHSLVPSWRLRGIESYKQYWNAMAPDASTGVDLGLVQPDWSDRCGDAFDRAMVLSVEAWLRGALGVGGTPLLDIAESP